MKVYSEIVREAYMKRFLVCRFIIVAALCAGTAHSQMKAKAQNVAEIPYESLRNFLKLLVRHYRLDPQGVLDAWSAWVDRAVPRAPMAARASTAARCDGGSGRVGILGIDVFPPGNLRACETPTEWRRSARPKPR